MEADPPPEACSNTHASQETNDVDVSAVAEDDTDEAVTETGPHLTLAHFMRGKLCDDEDTPEPASPAAASPATTRSTTYSVDGVDVPVAALAQAMAVRDLMNRDSSHERQLLKAAAKRDSSIAKDTATWRKDILPQWDEVCKSKRVRKLCLRGIPPAIRGEAWAAMLGNPHNITAELYNIYVDQARSTLAALRASHPTVATMFTPPTLLLPKERGREHSLALIDVDIPRTFPTLSFFASDGPLHEPLQNILFAYVCFRPDVGYVQGMSYLAAMLLLFVPDELCAFQCLTSLLSRHLCFDMFRLDREQLNVHFRVFDRFMLELLPDVAAHFKTLDIRTDMYLVEWLLTLYTRVLPLDVVARVWDAFFVLDEAFLMQIALGVLSFLRAQLLAAEFGPCLQMLRQVPSDVNPVELFDGISCVELSRSDYFEFVAQERAAAKAGGHPGSLKSPGKLNMFKSLFRAKR